MVDSFLNRVVFAAAVLFCSVPAVSAQHMAIVNANIATMDRDNPKAEAMLVKDGRITAVGSTEEIRKNVDARMIVLDLDGKFLMPGFIAVSYTHLTLPTICSV